MVEEDVCPEVESLFPAKFLKENLGFTITCIVILMLLSATFSGLTLGLLGLDKIGLDIVAHGDNKSAARNAKRIKPIREDGNLLLCTLLLGNVLVNAVLSIFTSSAFDELTGLILSVSVIVIFGEIIPQAACNRYALQVGAASVPVVWVLIVLFYVIAKPLALLLDCVLGEEVGTIHSRIEMMRLVEIHLKHGAVNKEEKNVMQGALKFKEVVLESIMTPADDVFMLPLEAKLDFDLLTEIFHSGYSRIPIYLRTPNHIVGVLYTKDLIFLDPEDCAPLERFLSVFGRKIETFFTHTKATHAFQVFKTGKAHMGLVKQINDTGEGDPFYEVKGIVTIEDLIEEILQEEIVDETDVYVDVDHQIPVVRPVDHQGNIDITGIRLFNPGFLDNERLSTDEIDAVAAHIITNIKPPKDTITGRRKWLARPEIGYLLSEKATVRKMARQSNKYGELVEDDWLYKHGEKYDHMSIILTGQVKIWSGAEKIRSISGSFSCFAVDALSDSYRVDVGVCINSEVLRVIEIKRSDYQELNRLIAGGGEIPAYEPGGVAGASSLGWKRLSAGFSHARKSELSEVAFSSRGSPCSPFSPESQKGVTRLLSPLSPHHVKTVPPPPPHADRDQERMPIVTIP